MLMLSNLVLSTFSKGPTKKCQKIFSKFGTTVKKKAHDAYGSFFKDVDMSKKSTKITFD